ncbi:MAG: class I SAM-dependent methyltransferase [Chlorobiaceae bacterium]|nr:class I SAM-dependent methyltransferase [Chlorobiaceae bacterium]
MYNGEHWENIYSSKPSNLLSWFQEQASLSLRLVIEHAGSKSCAIIDAGGGASTFADGLVKEGFRNLTVADISPSALEMSKARLGEDAKGIRWITGSILDIELPEKAFDIWHDRAVFHFLASEEEREAYAGKALRSLRTGGILIVAAFAEDGPEKCSGLNVTRYSPGILTAALGGRFTLLGHEDDFHLTPSGALQHFIYCTFKAGGTEPGSH